MGFMELSRRFFSYPSNQRQSATLEYRSSSGSSIGLGLRSADETTLLRGDGTIEFHRRGDFGGRGEYPPGRWISKCDTVQVERIWDKLGNLGPGSFPSRVADPGDAIQYVVACVPNVFASLAIGPEDPARVVSDSGAAGIRRVPLGRGNVLWKSGQDFPWRGGGVELP
jgi:hypothetical protein